MLTKTFFTAMLGSAIGVLIIVVPMYIFVSATVGAQLQLISAAVAQVNTVIDAVPSVDQLKDNGNLLNKFFGEQN